MAMTTTQRNHVVQNGSLAVQIDNYVRAHSIAPGNYALTHAGMCRHFGWDANDPTTNCSIAVYLASYKAAVDALQA